MMLEFVLGPLFAALTLTVTDLHRYAIKGLSYDALSSVELRTEHRFPHDRQYALLKESSVPSWTPGKFLHKENFLCAFTAPALLAQLVSRYDDATGTLEIRDRATHQLLLGPVDLRTDPNVVGAFLSRYSGVPVRCVTTSSSGGHFQFGNTGSGVKLNHDENAQTIHVRQYSHDLVLSLTTLCFAGLSPPRTTATNLSSILLLLSQTDGLSIDGPGFGRKDWGGTRSPPVPAQHDSRDNGCSTVCRVAMDWSIATVRPKRNTVKDH
jgi:hypothetical protein